MARLTLETNGNLTIKTLGMDNAKDIYHVLKSDENFFYIWINKNAVAKKLEDVKLFIAQELLRLEQDKEFLFSIEDKDGFCGIAGLCSTDKLNNKTEFVFWLSRRARTVQNYQIITETILKFGFNEQLFNRIQCKIGTKDLSLAGVLRKYGFKPEGIEKSGLFTPEKTYVDLHIYAILKTEYVAQTKYMVRASKIFQRQHKRNQIK